MKKTTIKCVLCVVIALLLVPITNGSQLLGAGADKKDTEGALPEDAEDPDSGSSAESSSSINAEPEPEELFTDVSEEKWYAAYITELYGLEIIPAMERFCPDEACTRGDFVSWIYNLYISVTGSEDYNKPYSAAFSDVPEDSEYYTAVMWAKDREIVNGVTETEFSPDTPLSREMSCTLLVRLLGSMEKDLDKVSDASLFDDTDSISKYAQSSVTASQMSGLVSGYEDNTFKPSNAVRRSEAAALIERTYNALTTDNESSETVSCIDGAYTELYTSLVEKRDAEIAAQKAAEEAARLAAEEAARKAEEEAERQRELEEKAARPVDASWFDDAVFIGDSVSQGLQMYCASTGALGNATFLCSQSFSAPANFGSITSSSTHPSYNGVKVRVEDGVAACGKTNVFIMLGINNMDGSVESTTASLVRLVNAILEKSPDVNIFIESVTPTTSTSTRVTSTFNNAKIASYNAAMKTYCEENGWYYMDIASAVSDENGYLKSNLCSDANGMGIHFNSSAAKLWIEYLKNNIPVELK